MPETDNNDPGSFDVFNIGERVITGTTSPTFVRRTYHANMQKNDGLQQGNPDKVADAFLQLVNSETPASDLFLGTDAFNRASIRLQQLNETMEQWKQQTTSTDFG